MIERIGNVFYRVANMEEAVSFYGDTLGLPLKFADGERWAAFDVSGLTLALEGAPGYAAAGGGATVSLRVRDLNAFTSRLREKGAPVGPVTEGAHERQAEVTDPSGNVLVLYEPLKTAH